MRRRRYAVGGDCLETRNLLIRNRRSASGRANKLDDARRLENPDARFG